MVFYFSTLMSCKIQVLKRSALAWIWLLSISPFYGCLPTVSLVNSSTKSEPYEITVRDNRGEKMLFALQSTGGTQYWNLGTDLESAIQNKISKSQLPIIVRRKNLSGGIEIDSLTVYMVDSAFLNLGLKCEIVGKAKFSNPNKKQLDKVIHVQHFSETSKFNTDQGDRVDIDCGSGVWERICTVMNLTIDKFISNVCVELDKEYL